MHRPPSQRNPCSTHQFSILKHISIVDNVSSLRIVDMFDGKVDTKALRRDLKLLCGESERLGYFSSKECER